MKIKICGITTLDDALAAVEAGADMLGYNFYPDSKRYLTPQTCAEIQTRLQNRGVTITTVGVFVNAPYEAIATILNDCGLDLAQLHGDEPPALLDVLGERAFKAIRLQTPVEARTAMQRYFRRATPPALLVDAYRPAQFGGTGHTGDWSLARTLAAEYPLLLAGGLRPDNVRAAVEQARPWGVDVASGVESSPGRKDPTKMSAFVRAARNF